MPARQQQASEHEPVPQPPEQPPVQARELAPIPQLTGQPPVLELSAAANAVQEILDQYYLEPLAMNDQSAQTDDEEVLPGPVRWNEVT